ncbi:hypothetical protein [Actinoplanes awajinensis]|uniref:Uncharacterized protein n=1 Tax=Actinoplanes awajinensis subsp. mycoplanecinus TaxID=135947 RepID=A0A0X3VES1_9ACTN|nr:hypothetical protein [Actinoplanes awajinensis]KUL41826.1 hypothetical protein ADL15_02960 [Actinoplanes awajinensis subsp. mycoplanecinus]
MSAQDATSSAAARRRWFITVLLALVILAVAAGYALSHKRVTGTGSLPAPATSTDASAPAAEPSVESSDLADPQSSESSEPSTGSHTPKVISTHKTSTSSSPSPEAPTGPSISYFRVASKPSCPSGTDQVKYEGDPVVLEWKVSHAESTTISVDGPGIYDTYGTKDSVSLNFPCGDAEPGSYATHTYLLTATGPDGTTTKKLTVRAKANEIATT